MHIKQHQLSNPENPNICIPKLNDTVTKPTPWRTANEKPAASQLLKISNFHHITYSYELIKCIDT